jgi:hypothetical protein
MPGLYDLLPTYRCVEERTHVRRLTVADVESIGGRADYAGAAFALRDRLAAVAIPRHRPLIGVRQPTICSLTIENGRVEPGFHTFEVGADGEIVRDGGNAPKRVPGNGDGTVPRNSAVPLHCHETAPLPQQHGPLAHTDEAIAFVEDRLLHRDSGPRLGDNDIGIRLPDIVSAGIEFLIEITGVENPNSIRTRVYDVETGRLVAGPRAQRRQDRVGVPVLLRQQGLYRMAIAGGGNSPVSQMVLAVEEGAV